MTTDPAKNILRKTGREFEQAERLFETGAVKSACSCASRDARWMATGSSNGQVRVFDLQSGRQARSLFVSTNECWPLAFWEHNSRLAVGEGTVPSYTTRGRNRFVILRGTASYRIHEMDLETGREVRSWQLESPSPHRHLGWVAGVADNGRWALAFSFEGPCRLLDLRTGAEQCGRSDFLRVVDAAFAPDGSAFVVASEQGFGRLFTTVPLRERAAFHGFLMAAFSADFSPDGGRLAFGGSGQETIKLWDLASNQEVLTLGSEGSLFRSCQFSPDGNLLGALSRDGTLHVWCAPSWEEIAAAEAQGR
jgi:WD40 repeat protein